MRAELGRELSLRGDRQAACVQVKREVEWPERELPREGARPVGAEGGIANGVQCVPVHVEFDLVAKLHAPLRVRIAGALAEEWRSEYPCARACREALYSVKP